MRTVDPAHSTRRIRSWILAAALAVAMACGSEPETPEPAAAPPVDDSQARALAERARAALGVLPSDAETPDRPLTKARIDLGRMLYYEKRISRNQDISCNACHPLDRYGVDNEPTSRGHMGQRGDRNAPSVYNAALHFAQFWDGRAADVEDQAKEQILDPVGMAMPADTDVLGVLRSIPDYPGLFAAAFPESSRDAIAYDHVGLALGAFERRLITPAPFDDFLDGDYAALSEDAQKGLELFLDVGCITCHHGPNIGGDMFQKLGLVEPYETGDTGRQALTGREADAYFFKVPSLRNVTETGPYLHDGSIGTLDQAVRLMAKHQLGKRLDDEQVRLLMAFLQSLTGRIDEGYVARPTLPESGPETPMPSNS